MLACLTAAAVGQGQVEPFDIDLTVGDSGQAPLSGSVAAVPAEYELRALARSWFVHDQRIRWSGQEDTFGVEGILGGAVLKCVHDWKVGVEAELFLNQPFDDNILVDTPERESYRANFEVETLEINQLFIQANRGDWTLTAGKQWTPFGRYYFPLHTNALQDAPFIRTEVINYRETGVFVGFQPGMLDMQVGLVNGSENKDTNSSKGIVARVGVNSELFSFGGSVKWQDGIGSEGQKYRDNQVGMDMMVRSGNWSLSGEVIYDEYGFRRPFDPLDITWGRSIYNRDQYFPDRLRGVGYYINLNYQCPGWTAVLNYGGYTPGVFTGDTIHDRTTNRGYCKVVRHMGQGLDVFTTLIVENELPVGQAGVERKGIAGYAGVQYQF